ncbi:hypothetical protein [Xanthomonas translucens]|uniref:hypothetical protein n=1 Tax=Xanthomonas campestris pv. translucens TaxID=343 RepID=UPI00071E73EF|nr:hypothetical protein [Xanthomonas translucens]QEN93623.1 hypothetical protein F0H33_09755 [Xanthomonas translucens pv. undulosa]QSQ58063.1 hypothetical protein ISN37_09070 [Xanthomonas translucens pv. undulosa]
MKDSSIRQFSLVPYTLALLVIVALTAALTWPSWGVVPKWMKEPAWPAWVQAVGSIAAIAVAMLIPAWQRRKELQTREHDQMLQAKIVAGAIQPFIPAYRRRAAFLLNALSEGAPVEKLQKVPEDAFDIPATVEQFHPSFHFLGEASELANRFVASLFWLQQGMKAIYHEDLRSETRAQISKDCENTISFAQQLSPLLEQMCGRIERLAGNVDINGVAGD